MGLVFVPIVEGQTIAWKNWIAELNGPRKEELKDLNRRYQLTHHNAWLVKTHDGYAAVAITEGPGEKNFHKHLAASNHPFDKWFREKIEEFHGVDVLNQEEGSKQLDSSN